MVQKCWWLLVLIIIAVTTFVFLPPQFKPDFVSLIAMRVLVGGAEKFRRSSKSIFLKLLFVRCQIPPRWRQFDPTKWGTSATVSCLRSFGEYLS